MKVLKCCGIRDVLENYEGIDMGGFNFVLSSKRYISPERAQKIETPMSTLRVGVFGEKNENGDWKSITKRELVNILLQARQAKVNAIQVHGTCDYGYIKQYNFLVIKSVTIEEFKTEEDKNIDFLIIDGHNPGSGQAYDYKKINTIKREVNFLVAGGVNEDNVASIFDIFKNNPYFCGVDIASGVEKGGNICIKKVKTILEKINNN